jgi:serine/threonine-protein kinase
VKIGPYEVLDELGQGGMGVVYRVRGADGREAALKLLGATLDPDKLAAFERELRLLNSFSMADGFVPVIDSGSEQGRWYLVMPLLEGGTLRQRLRAGKLKIQEAVRVVTAVAEAMGRAHERGVIHRDLKPENVLLDEAGRPFVADLGLAKHWRRGVLGASRSAGMTETGVVAGTPGYMAPEQLQDSKRAQPQADVFALGAILHEALTGRRPFEGAGLVGYADAILHTTPPLPSKLRVGVPAWLDEVVRRSLARTEKERFADARELARALRSGAPASRSRRGVVLVLAGLSLVALGGAAVLGRGSLPRLTAIPGRAKAVEEAPRSALDWRESGKARMKKGDLEGAIADFTAAIERDPRDALNWEARAQARDRSRDREGAKADLARTIELAPRQADPLYHRGRLRIADADYAGAVEDLTNALELKPDHFDALVARGVALMDLRRLDDASRDFTRATEIAPRRADGWGSRGLLRLEKGDAAGAATDLERAVEFETNPQKREDWMLSLERARNPAR